MPCNTHEQPKSVTETLPVERPSAGPATDWVSVKEAAHRSKISARTLTRWAANGLIFADRLGSGCGGWMVALNARGYPISTTPFRAGAASAAQTSAA